MISVEKQCYKCKNVFPISHFNKSGLKSNGDIRHHSYCKECEKATLRKYHTTARNLAGQQRRRRKTRAQRALQVAVASGRVKKEVCWACGNTNTQAHHPIYSLPLKVIWLCKKHHDETHYDMKYESK